MGNMLMGAFESPEQADSALRELEDKGYTPEEISAISSSNKYEDKGYEHTGSDMASSAASGALTGGVVGGLAGLLAGVGVFPAIAGLFIGGPIAAALGLAGAAATTAAGAVTGAAAGGLIGALTHMGVPHETAKSYDELVKNGGVVLGLSGHEEMSDEARQIMERHGAQNISTIDMAEEGGAKQADEATTPGSTERMDDGAREHEEAAMAGAGASRANPAFGETTGAESRAADSAREDNTAAGTAETGDSRPTGETSEGTAMADETERSRTKPGFGETTGAEGYSVDSLSEEMPAEGSTAAAAETVPSRSTPAFGETMSTETRSSDMVDYETKGQDTMAASKSAEQMRERRQRDLREQDRTEDL